MEIFPSRWLPSFQTNQRNRQEYKVVSITEISEFESKNQEAIKEVLIKVISKPLGVDELLEFAKKYSEIKV